MSCLDQIASGRQLKRPVVTEKLDILAHVATVTGRSQTDKPAVEPIFKVKFPSEALKHSVGVGGKGGFVITFETGFS